MRKRFLFVLRRAPHTGVRVRETLDLVLTAAAFDQSVRLLFLDDGVYQLKSGQRPDAIGLPPVAPWFEALELYDVEEVLVERESLEERGLGDAQLVIPVRVIGRSEIAALTAAQDVVMGS